MNAYTDKTKENKSQSMANEVSKKSNVSGPAFQFVDNRPEAVAQKKLQVMANNSPQTKQIAQWQSIANSHNAQHLNFISGNNKNGPIQRRPLSENERKQLEKYLIMAEEIEADYNKIKEIESTVICSALKLKEFHVMINEKTPYYDSYFSKLNEKKRIAHSSFKAYDSFKKLLNQYIYSGGKNGLINLKKYMRDLPEEDKVIIPLVMRFSNYLILVERLCAQTDFQCGKMYPLPDIAKLKSALETLIGKVKEHKSNDLNSIKALHHEISKSLETYPTWESALKRQFIELKWIDSKAGMGDLKDIGSINVASRSDKSEGYYMRSQEVHKMHIGKGKVNPFAERVEEYLAEGAKIYNIGGAKMKADTAMIQKELRSGRRRVSSKKMEGLRDDILEHKNKYVKYIVDHFKEGTHLKVPQAQLNAKYPCVLILFKDELMEKVSQSKDNIPEFLTHLLAGHINAALIKGRLRPLVDRRQSFGFMTPTITDVHSGVRLSLGVTPSDVWCDAVIQGIESADSDINSFAEYNSVPGNTEDKDSAFVIMNKFNQGSVLGAGHKLITQKLLSAMDKKSISQKEINEIFGTREGANVVFDILRVVKPKFEGQDVDKYSVMLYNRLKSFYEQLIKVSGGQVESEDVDWKSIDPAEKLQTLMDEGVRAAYNDSENVVGLDESSDEEDREPNRVPSGMSALFLPIASYSRTHKDRSIIYDTAPYSYFEIDGSWKKTFKLDYIERLGVRYARVIRTLKSEAFSHFDQIVNETIRTKTQSYSQAIEEIITKGETDVKTLQISQKSITSKKKQGEQNSEVEKIKEKIKGVETKVKEDVGKQKQEIEKITLKVNETYKEQKESLECLLNKLIGLLNNYRVCKEANFKESNTKTSNELDLASNSLTVFKTELKTSKPDELIIFNAFEKIDMGEVNKAANISRESNVEIAFVDLNPCMTSEEQFDSGEILYSQSMRKYDKLRMIIVDITSSTEKQVSDLITLFQNQKIDSEGKGIVPFLCLAKSGTKHDQFGLDISTMGRCHYVMHASFKNDIKMQEEFRNLKSASRYLSNNTEPLLVKKIRRDLRRAAYRSEAK